VQNALEGYFKSPEDAPPKWLLMFRAYLDESGHETRGWMFLAGYCGREEQWSNFVPRWQKALGQRKSLHMCDLRWNKPSTKSLLARLGPIPDACGLKGIAGGVRYQDYEDLVAGKPEEKIMKAYIVTLMAVVIPTLRHIPDGERIELVFEQQKQYEAYAILALQNFADEDHPWMRNTDGSPKLAKWSFVPKGSTLMTDPADYFAYALREVRVSGEHSKKSQWCMPILTAGNGEGYGTAFEREQIRRLIRNTYMLNMLRNLQFVPASKKG
jgi:hypothetical protein